MKKITLFAIACLMSTFAFSQVVINEIDADQAGNDTGEFIELKSTNPNESLDGYVVVLYNGSNDKSYAAYDLDGFTTDGNGFLLLANDGFPGQDISLGADNGLQNGADAVAIYTGDDSDFPNGTDVTDANLIDALVYGVNDSDDTDLLTGLGESVQYDEAVNGNQDTESIQRSSDGTFCVGASTPDAANINCAALCPLTISVDDVSCDASTTGTDTYTVTGSFSGGGTESYTFTVNAGTITSTDDPSTMATGSIVVTGIPEGTDFNYTISSSTCDIDETITSPICEPATDVADIATLRAGSEGVTYTLTGEAVLTFQQNYRNQKYIEDASGAILIDDADGNLTTSYNRGDGITGIKGELNEYNGILQFVPSEDPGAATSTGNTITPQIVSIEDYLSNYEEYESELIKFENVAIVEGDGTLTFQTGQGYTIANTGSDSVSMFTNFYNADYIDEVIPQGQLSYIIAIGAEYQDEGQVYVRDSNDIGSTMSTQTLEAGSFRLYPNPTASGFVTIEMVNTTDASVAIYNMLGQQVIAKELKNNRINVNQLNAGVYLVKVTANGQATTKKLIIK